MTQDRSKFKRIGFFSLYGWYILFVLTMIGVSLALAGCKTVKSEESTVDRHLVTELNTKMDSLICRTATWQETFLSRQTSLIDSVMQKEKNDSSHSVVVNEKGDTVRERIEIIRYIERSHTTDTKETEQLVERFRRTDSLLQVSLEKQEKTDSLLHEYQKSVVVEKKPSLWDRIVSKVGGYAIVIALISLIFVGFKTLRWLRRKRLTKV